MKTLIAGLAITAGIAGAGYMATPYLAAGQIEEFFAQPERRIPMMDQGFAWKGGSFQRGWWESTAVSTLKMHLDLDQTVDLPLRHVVHQGLGTDLSWAHIETTLEITEEDRALVRHYFGEQAPLRIVTTLFLDGHQESRIESPSFNTPMLEDPSSRLEWGGITGYANSPQADVLSLHIEAPRVALTDAATALEMESLVLSGDLKADAQIGSTGTGEVVLRRLTVKGEDENIQLSGLSLNSSARREGPLFGVDARLRMDHFEADDQRFDDLRLNWRVDRLDVAAYERMQTRLQSAMEPPANDEEEAQARQFQRLAQSLEEFLPSSPEFELTELAFRTPQGEVRMEGRARYDASAAPAKAALAERLPAVQAHLALQLPEALLSEVLQGVLVEQLESMQEMMGAAAEEIDAKAQATAMSGEMLAALKNEGWLKSDKSNLMARLELKQGNATINDQPAEALMLQLMPLLMGGEAAEVDVEEVEEAEDAEASVEAEEAEAAVEAGKAEAQ